MCKEGTSRDDTISNEYQTLWNRRYQSAQKAPNLVTPRCVIKKESPVRYELIGLCDVSEMGITYNLQVLYMITKNLYPVKS